MEIIEPESLEVFLDAFKQIPNSGECYFRGQSDFSWDIIPGLGRNKNISKTKNVHKVEGALYHKFRRKVNSKKLKSLIPIIKKSYHESWIYLMAAQHYGLPTRLMDFSNDKYSALEFAITEMTNLNKDGALIIYKNPNGLQEDLKSSILKNEFSHTHKDFFFQVPSLATKGNNEWNLSERRKRIQGSKFLYRGTSGLFKCLSTNKLHSNNLIKIKISKSMKLKLIEYLISEQRMAYDLYAGKNLIDYYAAILKLKFHDLKKAS